MKLGIMFVAFLSTNYHIKQTNKQANQQLRTVVPLFKVKLSIVLSFKSDIDECSADSSACDENAECENSEGSYICTCKEGFTGNGTVCEGMRRVHR